MMSVFWFIPQRQFLFLCSMRPTWRLGSVHVCECESAVCSASSIFFYLKDSFGLLEPGSYFYLFYDKLIIFEFLTVGQKKKKNNQKNEQFHVITL